MDAMPRHFAGGPAAVLTVAAMAGAACVAGQVALLRDVLTLFSGFEPAAGLTLAAWLMWTGAGSWLGAGRLFGRMSGRPGAAARALTWLIPVWAVALPASVLALRAARPLCGLPLGVMPGPGVMFAVALAAPAAVCLISGMVFTACWSLAASGGDGKSRPMRVYIAEAAGSALGGLVLQCVLMPLVPVLAATIGLGLAMAVLSLLLVRLSGPSGRAGVVTGALAAALLAASLAGSAALERASRTWQWGPDLAAWADSPYQNLAATSRQGQISFFGGGSWLFTAGDAQTAEFAAHLPLLMHPKAGRVLILGGDAYGLCAEAFKYPDVTAVDVVEPDTALYPLAASLLPLQAAALAADTRVRLIHQDAAAFVKAAGNAYDIILMQVPEPVSAQANRFYTLEFFMAARAALRPDGLLAFGLPSSPEGAGLAQARLLGSIAATLGAAFPHVLVAPGETARFFASAGEERITADVAVFEQRRERFGIDTRYVRDYYLIDVLSPFQIDRLAATLAEAGAQKVNSDFAPACYQSALVLAAAGVSPWLRRAFLAVGELRETWVAAACAALVLCAAALGRARGLKAAVPAAALAAGFGAMSLELLLLLAFQVLEGSLYGNLALLVAAVMAGLGLGAACGEARKEFAGPRTLAAVQTLLALMLAASPWLCRGAALAAAAAGAPPVAVFCVLAGVAGWLGGLHYCLAVRTAEPGDSPGALPAGRLYAMDLAGSAAGSLACGFILVPAFGLYATALMAALVCLAGTAALAAAGNNAK